MTATHQMLALLVAAACGSSGCLSYHRGAMRGEPEGATFASIGQTRVRYREEGETSGGEPVVLVHGFASALEAWAGVTPALRDHHHTLSMDLKGFGWTDRPEGDYSPRAQAELVLALMDQRGIDRAAFVAHSYGASVVMALALQAPERVSRIAIYDGWLYSAQLPTFFHMARADGVGEAMFSIWYGERAEDRIALAFYDRSFVTMELIDGVERALERPGTYRAALEAVRAMRYEEQERRYPEVNVPVLLLWGREDHVTPLSVGERLARELPNARLVTYAQCGHFPMIEHAASSTRELVAFLDAGAAPATATRAPSALSGGAISIAPAPPAAEAPVLDEPPAMDAEELAP